MRPTRTARQPSVAEAAPLASYARQFPFIPCKYHTNPNTLCLCERSKEKMRGANIYLGTPLLYRRKSRKIGFVMEDQPTEYNIVITNNIITHI